MSNIGGDRVNRPRDEGVYVPKIQEQKKEKEKFTKLPKDSEKKLLFATFFSYLKRLFDSFSPEKEMAGRVIDQHLIVENLKNFRDLLKKLSDKDLSNSSEFAYDLSECWSKLIEDFDNIEVVERKNLHKVAKFREVMDQIKNYPPESDHRLGYYLLQHTGKDWLPFPFIEMLKKLHQSRTQLSTWIEMINEVISHIMKPLVPPEEFERPNN